MEVCTFGGGEGLHGGGGVFGEPDSIEVDPVAGGIDVFEEVVVDGDRFVGAVDGDRLSSDELGGGVGVETPASETVTGVGIVGSG